MKANPGDCFIKGVAGEFYPCKPHTFDATYAAVEARQCDTPGCSNPALDHMVQIAPGTNVRVCQGCADAMFAE